MSNSTPCPHCDCRTGHPAHAILAALATDDGDSAIEAGLLDLAPCPGCTPACGDALMQARDVRQRALAARERFRARQARLQQRAQARAATRMPAPAPVAGPSLSPTLPPAAAAALARAKARAAGRQQ